MPPADAGDDLRHPEVDDDRLLPALEDHVRGLEIAMNDALRVRRPQRRADLEHDVERAPHLDRPLLLEHLLERRPVELRERHVDERLAVADRGHLTELEDRADVIALEALQDRRLALEPAADLQVARELRVHHLERDRRAVARADRVVDDARAALAEHST